MKRFSVFAAASALAFLCAACGGPEPKVYEMDIPGLGAEQQSADVVARVEDGEATAEAVAASLTQ